MELKSAEIDSLKNLLNSWLDNNNQELEATFGEKGQVDNSRFLAVAQRLRGKGFTPIPQEEYLTISLQNNLRFTIQGSEIIEAYCRDEDIAGKGAIVILKDKVGTEEDRDSVKLKEYDVKVKLRRELPLDMGDPRVKAAMLSWSQQTKYFRLIRRWSFEGNGCRFDLSMVRSTIKDERGIWKRITSFKEQNIPNAAPTYEIEVELKRNDETRVNPDNALMVFIRGLGEILRGIQKCSLLIRKSVKEKVLEEYGELVGTNRFRGVNPVTLERKNMEIGVAMIDNIRYGSFNVTDKADGLRAMGFCNSKGNFYLIDMAMNVYRTDLKREDCKNSLVDGEWITQNKKGEPINQYLIFDIYVYEKEDVSQRIFQFPNSVGKLRYDLMKDWITKWDNSAPSTAQPLNTLRVSLKTFLFSEPGKHNTIFTKCAQMLDQSTAYNTDGLIITRNDLELPKQPGIRFSQQFKWKPPKENTIDFMVKYVKEKDNPKEDKIVEVIKPGTLETVKYKTLRLYVGSSTDPAYDDPRYTILYQRPLPSGRPGWKKGGKSFHMKPVLFNPKELSDEFASVCNLVTVEDRGTKEFYVTTELRYDENGKEMGGGEPIQDNSIVEMRYDITAEPGWNWIPVRIRYDKTERLLSGTIEKTLNSDETAESVWNSIHNPITESMIRTGSDGPSEDERQQLLALIQSKSYGTKKYYHRDPYAKNKDLARALRSFHNIYIKEQILIKPTLTASRERNVWDMSVGQGGDIRKYIDSGCTSLVGTDIAEEGIRDPVQGAYRRYMNYLMKLGQSQQANAPPLLFIAADSSKQYRNGVAGVTTEESDMLKAVLGQEPSTRVPPYVERKWKGKYANGVDIMTSMFSLHYFFQDKVTFDGFLQNIRENLKVGGYFICCYTDGQMIYDMFRDKEKGEELVGLTDDDRVLYRLVKQYDLAEDSLPESVEEGFGHQYDVEFATIGATHKEYLVPFGLLLEQLNSIGCRLLIDQDKSAFKIPVYKESTDLFKNTYAELMASNRTDKVNYVMSPSELTYSSTNRWCIFRRYGKGPSDMLVQAVETKVEEQVPPGYLTPDYGAMFAPTQTSNVVSSTWNTIPLSGNVQQDNAMRSVQPVYPAYSPVFSPQGTTTYQPTSPVFSPQGTTTYQPTSPVFSPQGTSTIQYQAQSPTYFPTSPVFSPQGTTTIPYGPPGASPKFSPSTPTLTGQPKSPEFSPQNTGIQLPATTSPTLGPGGETTTIVPPLSPNYSAVQQSTAWQNNDDAPPPVPFTVNNQGVVTAVVKGGVRSVPVEKAIAAGKQKKYPAHQIFRFFGRAEIRDSLKIEDPGAGRWLALSAPFPIEDKSVDPPVKYPSVNHYLAGMKYKLATDKPEIAVNLLSSTGTIHSKYLRQRDETAKHHKASKDKPQVTEQEDSELLRAEAADVADAALEKTIKRYRATFDEAKWIAHKDDVLREALQQRWDRDQRFHKIVEAARAQQKYLLYYTGSSTVSNFGGIYRKDGTIEGENLVGNIIMEIAKFPGLETK